MTMKKWIQLNEIGVLYLEIVLVQFDVPLLFVCKDDDGVRYLILCIDEEEGQYLSSQISNKWLLKLLNNEVTMAEAFRHPINKRDFLIEYDFSSKKFNGHYIEVSQLTSDMLPDEGAYFKLRNPKIIDYIERISNESEYQYDKVVSCTLKKYIETFDKQYTQIFLPAIEKSDEKRKYNWRCRTTSDLDFVVNYIRRLPKQSFMVMDCKNFKEVDETLYNIERSHFSKCLMKI